LKSSFLNNSTDKDIDGLIFKFDGKESFRVSNPEVALSKSERKEEKPSDIYNLTLVILQEFLMGLDFKKIKLKEKIYEERYIEFISKVFNLFLQSPQYIKNFEKGVDFELPKFLTRAESNVNFKFVKDPETLSALEKSSTNRELFKILMASMRSHKKRPSGFFSKELIFHHNKLVDKIADYVGSKEGVKAIEIKEASFVSFQEFKKVFLTESSTWQEEFGKEAPEEESQLQIFETSAEVVSLGDESQEPLEVVSFPTYSEVVKEEEISRPLEVLKKIATSSQEPQNKKRTSICLMMGKFQPFHNGHLSCIEDAAEASGCKIFIVVTTKRLPENGITRDLHYSMLKDVLEGNKKVSGIVFSNGRSVREVINDLPKTYDVKSFAGSEDECEDIRTQISGIEVFPMTKHLSSKTVFQKIREEDYEGYRKLVPKSLHNYFYKIKNEMTD
jgi:nicotinamide mononucleotide adenylyltransferase